VYVFQILHLEAVNSKHSCHGARREERRRLKHSVGQGNFAETLITGGVKHISL